MSAAEERRKARIRAQETFARLRATVDAIGIHLADGISTPDARQALVQTAVSFSDDYADRDDGDQDPDWTDDVDDYDGWPERAR